jgi:hypothetical protein
MVFSKCNGVNYTVKNIRNVFDIFFKKFKDLIIVLYLYYRGGRVPPIDDLMQMLSKCKIEIKVHKIDCKYVLSNKFSREILIIAQ